jgi:hypothetical protein
MTNLPNEQVIRAAGTSDLGGDDRQQPMIDEVFSDQY